MKLLAVYICLDLKNSANLKFTETFVLKHILDSIL
jgi:hypothetical protein